MTRGTNLALMFALGIAGGVAMPSPAVAQPAAALGKPLPSPELAVGTISVRIVAGSTASPVVGTDVTLVVNNTPRAARTDAEGRATFVGLPVGATVMAKVLDQDKAEHASEEFVIPDAGGMKVMITTKPWQASAGGAPFAGGGAGMPSPRKLSGEARPEQSDPAGMVTVRVAYDDFKDTPEGVLVVLVGYVFDNTTTYQVAKTDKAGRVQFTGLDRSGGTSYFLMTLLPRNGAIDRLITPMPLVLESQMGMRLVLSGEKRDSKEPPVDDLGKADPQVATPAGKVRVALEGLADLTATVTLVDAATKKVIGAAKPEASEPDPSRVQGGAQFDPDAKLPAGTLDIEVAGGPGQTEEPLKDVEIRIIPATSTSPTGGLASVTTSNGTVRMALQVTEPQKAVFTINGRPFVSQPFELTKSGGKLMIRVHWDDRGKPQALFDLTPTPGQVVYAECVFKNQPFRSMPFQLLETTGSKISVYVYPRTLFRFQLQTLVDDAQVGVQGRFEVTNYSWAPYRAGPDGLLVPAPRGFKGGIVFDPDQSEVAVAAGEGFRIIRPLPPVTGRVFHGGFSLPVEDGKVAWSLDLPMGATDSEIAVKKTAGLTVQTPPGVNSQTRTVPQGTYILLGPILIERGRSMVMSLEGLPSAPAWRKWVSSIVGVLVVVVMLVGVFLAVYRKQPAAVAVASSESRRQKLLDELVELERSGEDPKRREELLSELEQLWT